MSGAGLFCHAMLRPTVLHCAALSCAHALPASSDFPTAFSITKPPLCCSDVFDAATIGRLGNQSVVYQGASPSELSVWLDMCSRVAVGAAISVKQGAAIRDRATYTPTQGGSQPLLVSMRARVKGCAGA